MPLWYNAKAMIETLTQEEVDELYDVRSDHKDFKTIFICARCLTTLMYTRGRIDMPFYEFETDHEKRKGIKVIKGFV